MKWWNGFGRTLLFAALCAAACPVYLGFVGLLVGWKLAMATFLIGAAALYLFGIARQPLRGLGAAAAVGVCGLGMLALGASVAELAVLLAVLVGVFRSGLLCPGGDAFARRFVIELGLVGAGLALAFQLGASSVVPMALAVWGFFMAQSAFFLVGGPQAEAARRAAEPLADVDPFERATRRAAALLDESP